MIVCLLNVGFTAFFVHRPAADQSELRLRVVTAKLRMPFERPGSNGDVITARHREGWAIDEDRPRR